jgi:hypothetical protein
MIIDINRPLRLVMALGKRKRREDSPSEPDVKRRKKICTGTGYDINPYGYPSGWNPFSTMCVPTAADELSCPTVTLTA